MNQMDWLLQRYLFFLKFNREVAGLSIYIPSNGITLSALW